MKKLPLIAIAMLSFALFGTSGCSKGEIDTSKVQAVFASDAAIDKAELERGLAAVKSGEYKKALEPLEKIAYRSHLSKEQRDVLMELLRQTRARAAASK